MSLQGIEGFTPRAIHNFLTNYLEINEGSIEQKLHQQTLANINKYLTQNKDWIFDLTNWDAVKEIKDIKYNASLKVHSVDYKISKDQHKRAIEWCQLFQLNYDLTVKSIVQNSPNDEITILESVLMDRVSLLDIILAFLDQPTLNEECYKWILSPETRNKLVHGLIKVINSTVSHFISLNEPTHTVNPQANNKERKQWIHEKNLNDLVYISKALKVITMLTLNYPTLQFEDCVMDWFQNITLWIQFCQSDLLVALPEVSFSILSQIVSLIDVNSILILGFDTAYKSFEMDQSSYFNDAQNFIKLQTVIDNDLSENAVASYCWSCILFLKSVYLETEEIEDNNDFLLQYNKEFPNVSLTTMSTFFAQRAEQLNVFQDITTVATSLQIDILYPTIMTAFITFLLNFVPLTKEISIMIQSILLQTPTQFVEEFLTSDIFTQKFAVIRAKLPLVEDALLPFINLITTLPEFAHFELKTLTTYATRTKLNDSDYDILDETNVYPSLTNDQSPSTSDSLTTTTGSNTNNELIVLKNEIFVQLPFEMDQTVMMPIPKDTKAQLLQVPTMNNQSNNSLMTINTDGELTKPDMTDISLKDTTNNDSNLIIYSMNYNGWSLMGRILQNVSLLYFNNGSNLDSTTKQLMISIIKLVSTIVDSNVIDKERSQEILDSLSSQINNENEDIVSIIFKIYEIALNKRDYVVLCQCSNFTNLLVGYYPHLVWSYLIRSTLLEKYGKTGLISTILGTIELPNGKYDFTINLSHLINLLIEDTFKQDNITPIRTKKDIIQKFTIHFIHVFENSQFWKFNEIHQKFELCLNLTNFFYTVLFNVYGIDPETPLNEKITGVLSTASETIVAFFLENQSTDSYTTKSLISILTSYPKQEYSTYGNQTFDDLYHDLMLSSYKLTNLFISIRDLLKLQPSILEQNIFNHSTTLVDLYTTNPALKRPIISLFHHLVNISWTDNYLFLLSYLGEKKAVELLNTISLDLQSDLNDFKLLRDIYLFIGSLLQSKQDGLALLFLTGKMVSSDEIKNANHDEGKKISNIEIASDKSILNILKINTLNMDKFPEFVSCALLDCISFAFNSWLHSKNLKNDVKFINALLDKFNNFVPQLSTTISLEQMGAVTQQYRSISRIIEIFALYLYMCPEKSSGVYKLLDDKKLFARIKPFFVYDKDERELQETLINKFNSTYGCYPLSRFSLTQLNNSGNKFQNGLFNMDLMNKLFRDDPKWIGFEEDTGLFQAVQQISSFVEYDHYKITAAKSWGALISSYIKINGSLNDEFIDIAVHFLEINIEVEINKDSFSQLYHERLELIFFILYSFQKSKKRVPDARLLDILRLQIRTFKSSQIDYLNNVALSSRKSGYRSVLHCVLIVLNLVQDPAKFVELASDQLLEFFEWAFSKGIYIIFHKIISDTSNALTSQNKLSLFTLDEKMQDISLLLSLFSKIKSLNPSEHFNQILASSLYDTGTIKVILNMYSNAHLRVANTQPSLGTTALNMISQLCTIPEVAEQFVRNGLFVVLLESPLSILLQEGDVRPEYKPKLHSVWSNGLLSIVLLLLSTFGNKLLPETCVFLNYFNKQVAGAVASWTDNKLAISTALIRETSQLIMLQKMLEKLNYKRYLEENGNITRTDEEEPLGLIAGLDEDYERSELYVTLGNLLTHPKYLNSRIVAVTVEEKEQLENTVSRIKLVNQINTDIKELQQSLMNGI